MNEAELAKKLGVSRMHAAILDESWSHMYGCNCDVCLSGWALMGPDGGEPGKYGPFTKEQVNARQREMGEEESG